jgi:hypothetical protein
MWRSYALEEKVLLQAVDALLSACLNDVLPGWAGTSAF